MCAKIEKAEVQNQSESSRNDDLEEMRDILASAEMGTWHIELIEGETPRMRADEKMQSLLGIDARGMSSEEVYEAWYSHIKPEALPSVLRSVEKMKSGMRDENTYLWNHPQLGDRYVRCGGTAVTVPGGHILRGYHYDVDTLVREQLEMQEQLKRSALEAKKANISKTNFLRRMSHDIRTPLNGIIGMLKISDRYMDDPAKLAECKEKILHSADYLLELVNNVMDISKLESGDRKLEEKSFDMREKLLKMLSTVEVSASQHGIRLEGGKEASHIVHPHLIGSSAYLNRVLMNLASNAIKYNRPGGMVRLYCNELSSDAESANFEFVCEDNGLGMSPDFQQHAFEPFTRENKETTTGFSGSGLGLSIVKELVTMMGGTIALESEENVGTRFTIHLRFRLDPKDEKKEDVLEKGQPLQIHGRRALLVEDNDLNLEIAKILLEDEGLEIETAKNGKEALDKFSAAAPGYFSYIFMDVMMPVMDGLESTRQIRALEKADAKTIPIIAMTANAFAEDKEACLNAGMDAHLAKPIRPKELRKAIVKFGQTG